jgi:hypothetical protein
VVDDRTEDARWPHDGKELASFYDAANIVENHLRLAGTSLRNRDSHPLPDESFHRVVLQVGEPVVTHLLQVRHRRNQDGYARNDIEYRRNDNEYRRNDNEYRRNEDEYERKLSGHF